MKQPKPRPPSHLSENMAKFWRRLTSEYKFNEEHLYILRIACEAFDRTQAARSAIATDGMLLGGKRHPLIGVEAKSSEVFLRAIRDLGLETEVRNAPK